MKIWQWGESKVNGIVGGVDSNYGYFDIDTTPTEPAKNAVTNNGKDLEAGDIVEVVKGQNYLYGTSKKFTVYYNTYTVMQDVSGSRAVIGKNGVVTAAVDVANLKRV